MSSPASFEIINLCFRNVPSCGKWELEVYTHYYVNFLVKENRFQFNSAFFFLEKKKQIWGCGFKFPSSREICFLYLKVRINAILEEVNMRVRFSN